MQCVRFIAGTWVRQHLHLLCIASCLTRHIFVYLFFRRVTRRNAAMRHHGHFVLVLSRTQGGWLDSAQIAPCRVPCPSLCDELCALLYGTPC